MKCTKCKTEIIKGEKFCLNCGNKIKNKTKMDYVMTSLIIIVSLAIVGVFIYLLCFLNKKNEFTYTGNIYPLQYLDLFEEENVYDDYKNIIGNDDEEYRIITSSKEFEPFYNYLSTYNYYKKDIKKYDDAYFNKYNLILIRSNILLCNIDAVKTSINEIRKEGNKLYVDIGMSSLGSCASSVDYYILIEAEKDIKEVDFEICFEGNMFENAIVKKPILYLYPTKDMNVSISFKHPENLITTYPKYQSEWNAFVKKNGDIYMDGKNYYALYWDEVNTHNVDFSEGFYVSGEDSVNFLEDKLALIGLNSREANEFIMYWLPVLESNKHNLVYFELTSERNKYSKINITPKPDSILRVAMHVKKVDKKVNIKEQKLPSFKRSGFSAVEWGGINYNE